MIRNEDVQSTEGFDRAVDGARDALRRRDVDDDPDRPAAVGSDRVPHQVGRPVGGHDTRAVAHQPFDRGSANATTGTGDERHALRQTPWLRP